MSITVYQCPTCSRITTEQWDFCKNHEKIVGLRKIDMEVKV